MAGRAHDILVIKTCHSLAHLGHTVYLVIGKTHSSENTILDFYGLKENPNFHIIQIPILRRSRFPKVSWHFVFNIFCLTKILFMKRKIHFDVLYLSEIKLAMFLLKFKKLIHIPFIYEVHGLYAKNYLTPHEREKVVFSQCDWMVTTTFELKKKLLEIYSIPSPISIVPLAASDGDDSDIVVKKNERKKIFYAGQFYYLQGVHILIQAMSYLPDWAELHLIGGKKDEIAKLSALGQSMNVNDRITFHRFVPHAAVSSLLKEADVFVLPSLAEGKMPYVAHTKIYEYSMLGKPIVATDLPSIREEIKDGVNGILVKPADPHALAEGILKALNDPELAYALSRNTFEKSKEYTWEKRAERLVKVFQNILLYDFQMVV